MLHGQPKVGIVDAGAVAGGVSGDDYQAAVDLVAIVHPRRILLTDVAALGKADAVQLRGVAFEPEGLVGTQLGHAFGDAQREAVPEPGFGRARPARGRCKAAAAEPGKARIAWSLAVERPLDAKHFLPAYLDRKSTRLNSSH